LIFVSNIVTAPHLKMSTSAAVGSPIYIWSSRTCVERWIPPEQAGGFVEIFGLAKQVNT